MLVAISLVLIAPTYIVTYLPGGETSQQAKKRVGGIEVIGGGYYATARGVRHSIDLVIVEGKVIIPYRSDLGRPVLVIEKDGDIRIDQPYKKQPDDWYAVAGAKVPADPTLSTNRQIVGVIGKTLKFYQITGTYRQCERRVKVPHIYMDGGSSAHPGVKMPSHIVKLKGG